MGDASQVAGSSQANEKGGTLPTTGKHGGVGSKNAAGAVHKSDGPGATSGPFQSLGNPGSEDEEACDNHDAMVLPPIGGIKAGSQKVGPGGGVSKSHGAKPLRAVKVGAGAALQKTRVESGAY